jgi:hypothetical protein
VKPSELYYKVLDKTLNLTLVEATMDNEDDRRERRAGIAENPHLIKRVGALALHHAVHTVGAQNVRDIYEIPYRRRGIDIIGYGYTATAFREPGSETVRKIIRGTDRLSDEERAEQAQKLKDLVAVSHRFHPEVAIPTSVEIAPSPVLSRPTIQLVQPFVTSSAERPDPRQIRDFAEISLEEMMPTGYIPDVKGMHNLINTEDGIRLIDTVPITTEDMRTFGRCAVRLYEMAKISE